MGNLVLFETIQTYKFIASALVQGTWINRDTAWRRFYINCFIESCIMLSWIVLFPFLASYYFVFNFVCLIFLVCKISLDAEGVDTFRNGENTSWREYVI